MNDNDVRLKQFRKHFSLTQEAIGAIMGIAKSSYSSIENGASSLTTENLKKLHLHFGLNPTWYLTGEGEMIIEKNKPVILTPENTVAQLVRLGADKLQGKEIVEAKAIPIYDIKATAGAMELIFPQHITEEMLLHIPELKGCDFAVKVYGDSMEGLILNGDMIACKNIAASHQIQNGKIYLVQTSTNLYVKYVYKMPNILILNSENKFYDPIMVEPGDIMKMYEVIWGIRLTKFN